jgi:hypothetical protein
MLMPGGFKIFLLAGGLKHVSHALEEVPAF